MRSGRTSRSVTRPSPTGWTSSIACRPEALPASHLLKFCHFLEDTEGYRIELRFLRDKEKREVDFLVLVDRKPWFAVEVKSGKENPSSHFSYFGDRLHIPYLYQVVWDLDASHTRNDVLVVSPMDFLGALR